MFEPDDDDVFSLRGCGDPNHFPPMGLLITRSGWWVCPTCGHRTRIIGPPICTMDCRGVNVGNTTNTNMFRVRPGVNDTTLL